MSTLYDVSVRRLENDTTAVLDLQVVHPDSMSISATPGFALMLLSEPAHGDDPLAGEVDLETSVDAAWMRKYAKGFIRDVEIVELDNEPPAAARANHQHAYWEQPDGWLRGTIRIEVSDPAWISHLAADLAWDSTAFEANTSFDACEPIRFEQEQAPAAADDSRAGMIPVPRVFFLELLGDFDDDVVWFPKYGEAAYIADEVYEGEAVTEAVIESLIGEVVYFSRFDDGVGVMRPDGDVAHISKSMHGLAEIRPGCGKLGRARFNTSKERLGEPLTIAGLTESASPAIVDAEVDGATVSLTVYRFTDGRRLAVEHEADALALIAMREHESMANFANATSKLGKLLHAKAQEHDVDYKDDIIQKFAKGIIVDSTIEKTKEGEPVDFDSLPEADLVAKLNEHPWETWTIAITVSDPALIEHFSSITPYSHGFGWIGDPEPWEGEPLTADA